MTEPIIKTVVVRCDAARAFEIFAQETSSWWPLGGHAVSARDNKAALAVTIEPNVGGAVYETMHDGSRADWGTVLEYVLGARLVITWHPGTKAENPTKVAVDFEDVPGGQCRVTLTHSGWERWADRAEDMRRNYDSGWDFVLGERFVSAF
ncbi:uncharacterized protein YndB with AHSA1/START domain [Shimia isoporae]|uniref:Uncharacterized protein YndB with AHSA1/START domain n=1 Tax=Shimia isoporae TaxID=647720 RepID=A0A4R1NK91_9RHOB|nr:SRPBCC domain-containing protein [Shimia isoporae]TCL08634.1 uncharacterized protein YndB with AHSA1/START domain [Shimia isoporae]